ncbi:MAG: aminotransferase class V-fold PLP-dependent enzyme [Bacillota bacterium]|nr:aminotransferase class V-fold PLP-dependent enzyme [Bacillota bacterium]
MNQVKTPLYDALVNHLNKNPFSFHVPGHKSGKVFHEKALELYSNFLKMDVTELSGLDDLHSPEGPISEAQLLLADLYHVEQSFFLINGSTVGNLAMVMSSCHENDIVFVQRNCHKSIMNALKLAKATPIFLEPEFDCVWNVAAGVHPSTVKEAFEFNPEVKAIILTHPNYYGIVNDIEKIISFAHMHNIPVLVDEAHGPHFILGGLFPSSAVQLGADMVVQSAHKTLPAMTMGSYLHFNSKRINLNKVKDYLHLFQSSSPSYPIMASLDLARSYLATYTLRDMNFLQQEIEKFKLSLSKIRGIKILQYPNQGDPLKITIQSTTGVSGFALQKSLEDNGIYTELADPYNVLFVYPLLKDKQAYPIKVVVERIKRAIEEIPSEPIRKGTVSIPTNKISRLSVSYRDMEQLGVVEIPISECVDKVAAETIIPYPPGIPLLLAGEKISKQIADHLKRLIKHGARFQGGLELAKGNVKIFKLPK